MNEFTFLSVEDVLLLHTDTIDMDGGSQGVRDHSLLDAAVAMPRQYSMASISMKILPRWPRRISFTSLRIIPSSTEISGRE